MSAALVDLLELWRTNAALVISVCAVVLTLASASATRKHNRLSVRPHMATFTTRGPDKDDSSVYVVAVTLRNCGLGPAIIRKFEVLLDGVPVAVEKPDDLFPIFDETIKAEKVVSKCNFAVLHPDHAMAKDEVVPVATVAIRPPFYPEMEDDLQRFHLRVTFESMYGESFCYDSRDHRRQLDTRPRSQNEATVGSSRSS